MRGSSFAGRPSSRFTAIVAALTAVLFIGLCTGCRRAREPQNLVLITIDTLRARNLSCYGYPRETSPAIDALAERGARFATAYCEVPITAPSHASILTGLASPTHGVRTNGLYVLPASAVTLAEVLRDAGFQTAAFVGAIPLDHRFGLAQGFDTYDDDFAQSVLAGKHPQDWYGIRLAQGERRASEVVDRAVAWLRSRPHGRFFLWVHLFDPHSPYDPPAPFDAAFPPAPQGPLINDLAPIKARGAPWHEWLEPYTEIRQVVGLYDGEIRSTDTQVDRLVRAVDECCDSRATLLCLTADHGESLTEHGYFFFHGDLLYEASLEVPLIFVSPAAIPAGRVPEGPAELADVFPTVLELLGLPLPLSLRGQSLVPELTARGRMPARDFYHEAAVRDGSGNAVRAIRRGDWKLIEYPDGRTELFDFRADPAEAFDLAAADPRQAVQLRDDLHALALRLAAPSEGARPGILDPEALNALRSLGYTQ